MIGKVSCYGIELSFVTDRKLEESQLNALIGWLEAVIATITVIHTGHVVVTWTHNATSLGVYISRSEVDT